MNPYIIFDQYDREEDIRRHKSVAMFSYLGLFFLIPLLQARRSPFAQFHAKQGMKLFACSLIVELTCNILERILFFFAKIPFVGTVFDILATLVSVVGAVGAIFFFVLMILGLVSAAKGRTDELKYIGKLRFFNIEIGQPFFFTSEENEFGYVKDEVKTNKIMVIACYFLPLLSLIPLFAGKSSKYLVDNAKRSLNLFIFNLIVLFVLTAAEVLFVFLAVGPNLATLFEMNVIPSLSAVLGTLDFGMWWFAIAPVALLISAWEMLVLAIQVIYSIKAFKGDNTELPFFGKLKIIR